MKRLFCSFVIVIFVGQLFAQKKELTQELLIGKSKVSRSAAGASVRWVDDTKFVLTNKKSYLVQAKTGTKTEISQEEKQALFKDTETKAVLVENDIYIKTFDKLERLTNTPEKENNPTLSPDNNYVAFTRGNDLYTIRVVDKKEFRLTTDGSDVVLNGFATWAYMEEIFGRNTAHKAFWWSPDSKTLAFFKFDDTKVPLFTITDSPSQNGYIEQWRYPKPGNPNAETKLGIVKPEGNNIVWADFNEKDDQYFGTPFWKPNSEGILVQWMPRVQNTLIIYDVNLTTGTKEEIYKETQKTWVDLATKLSFVNNNEALLLSDKSGWRHIYKLNIVTKELKKLTDGEYSVFGISHISKDYAYFTCDKDNIACTDFYKVKLDGKNLERLSFGAYNHNISISPKGTYFTSDYSNITTPNIVALYTTKGKRIAELHNTKQESTTEYNWPKSELFVLKSEDDKFNLPVQITWPLNMEEGKKYPVLIDVYGGPEAVQVRNIWGRVSSNRSAWFAKEGLIQVSIDHRGALHNGKLGQEYMYENLGEWEIKDYSQCVAWLIKNAQVDPTKVCINGFSYGGYISSMALCLAPDVFTHAIAGGSVTDWTLYDAPYTERFMNLPINNPEGYKKSSVIENAEKIKGKLLLTHGAIDENVHLQNTMQLVDKLMDYNKDFELMIYPQSRHGYGGKKHKHFRTLQDRFIYKYLLEKDIPIQLIE